MDELDDFRREQQCSEWKNTNDKSRRLYYCRDCPYTRCAMLPVPTTDNAEGPILLYSNGMHSHPVVPFRKRTIITLLREVNSLGEVERRRKELRLGAIASETRTGCATAAMAVL